MEAPTFADCKSGVVYSSVRFSVEMSCPDTGKARGSSCLSCAPSSRPGASSADKCCGGSGELDEEEGEKW